MTAPTMDPMMPLGAQLDAVAGQQADQQATHERAGQPAAERQGPVGAAPVAEDELGGGTGDHAEAG